MTESLPMIKSKKHGIKSGLKLPEESTQDAVSTETANDSLLLNICELPHASRLAGAAGFEPADADTKNRCLTTWRRPKTSACDRPYSSAFSYGNSLNQSYAPNCARQAPFRAELRPASPSSASSIAPGRPHQC